MESTVLLNKSDMELVHCAIGSVIVNALCSNTLSHEEKMESVEFWDKFREKFETR